MNEKTDTFVLTYENGVRLDQSSQDVSWSSDEVLFVDPGKGTKGIRVVDSFEDPNFKVWMKIAAFPKFLKLYSIINQDLKKGVYKIEITNCSSPPSYSIFIIYLIIIVFSIIHLQYLYYYY